MILAHVLILTLSLLASAFFSGIETGIVSMHRFRLRHLVRQGHRNAKILEFFAENFDRLLGTTLVGNNIVLVIMSVATSSLAMELHIPAAQMVAPVVVSVVVIIFGEYLPK
ncbi:MAG TPA: magnesium/cobalt efflux protein, partial [Verrucomicrobia bacterium]|nr:magnesium/cobalt efflux protein [Verrucomicrobiota bacterium]